MHKERRMIRMVPGAAASGLERRENVLSVGLSVRQAGSVPGRLFGSLGRNTLQLEFGDLDERVIASAMVVLSPLIGPNFDAVTLAALLANRDFRGRYVAFTTTLPNIRLVHDEVSVVAPELSFDLIEIGHGPHLAED